MTSSNNAMIGPTPRDDFMRSILGKSGTFYLFPSIANKRDLLAMNSTPFDAVGGV